MACCVSNQEEPGWAIWAYRWGVLDQCPFTSFPPRGLRLHAPQAATDPGEMPELTGRLPLVKSPPMNFALDTMPFWLSGGAYLPANRGR